MKQPREAVRAFPWQCKHCGKKEVYPATIEYMADWRHDGRLYSFPVSKLRIPICSSCGERVFTEQVDQQITDAFRDYLGLLKPDQIRDAITRLGMSQKEVCDRLGIAEATLSRWLNEIQVQSKAMDRFLRVFFAFPQVRDVLDGDLAGLSMPAVSSNA